MIHSPLLRLCTTLLLGTLIVAGIIILLTSFESTGAYYEFVQNAIARALS